jgi:tetratricopeptide (TPR) repeat protein
VAHLKLGTLLETRGAAADALASYERALQLEPSRVDALVRLARLRAAQGDVTAAEAAFRRALAVRSDLAELHFELGNLYQQQGRMEDSAECYRSALAIKPELAEAECNLGHALREMQQPDAAIEHLRRATALAPDLMAARVNLGTALADLGRFDEARACFAIALDREPDRPDVLYNLGIVARDQGDVEQAITLFDRAIGLRPNYQEAICARGAAFLGLGRLAEGWPGYEQRIGLPQYDTWNLPQPRWDGSPLGERRLLVHCEQGYGDTFQFVRYLNLVRKLGEHVILAADETLIPLLDQSGFAPLAARQDPLPPFDVQVPLLSLPHVFGTRLETIPADVPYLAAEATRVERWRAKLAEHRGLKVGIAWQGRKQFRGDRLRSVPLAHFAPLAAIDGVQLVSLQVGHGIEQLAQLAPTPIVDLSFELAHDAGVFQETAAILCSLDLVITSDTAVAHLAGALAVPVWVALGFAPDWRWLFDREDCPWYPTMRLFRQSQAGDWTGVFRRIADELTTLAH